MLRTPPPLCKGRWQSEGLTEGLLRCYALRTVGVAGDNPSAPSGQLPLHKGAIAAFLAAAAARYGAGDQWSPLQGGSQ